MRMEQNNEAENGLSEAVDIRETSLGQNHPTKIDCEKCYFYFNFYSSFLRF